MSEPDAPKPATLDRLNDLADVILQKAISAGTSFEDQLDAFKHLTNFYIGIAKIKPPKPPAGDEGETFDDLRKRIQQAETGRPGPDSSGSDLA